MYPEYELRVNYILEAFMEYFEEALLRYDTNEENNGLEDYIDMILKIFDERIVKAHKTSYVQYFLLYICSKENMKEFRQKFISLLIIQSFNYKLASNVRLVYFNYFVSFVASFRSLEAEIVIAAMKMSIEKALEIKPKLNPINFARLTQGFLYIACYKWEKLKEDQEFNIGQFIQQIIIANTQSLLYVEGSILEETTLLLQNESDMEYDKAINCLQKSLEEQKEKKIIPAPAYYLFGGIKLLPVIHARLKDTICFFTYRQQVSGERKTSSVNTANSGNADGSENKRRNDTSEYMEMEQST